MAKTVNHVRCFIRINKYNFDPLYYDLRAIFLQHPLLHVDHAARSVPHTPNYAITFAPIAHDSPGASRSTS